MGFIPLLTLLLACRPADPGPPVPEAHAWKDEAALVSDGLHEVLALVEGGNRAAARILAEQVYTDRWEPRLEPALREIEGPTTTAQVEYEFGQLLTDLEGNTPRNRLEERVRRLDGRVNGVAEAAARRFPSAADRAAPPPPAPDAASKPVVPEVKPRWEGG